MPRNEWGNWKAALLGFSALLFVFGMFGSYRLLNWLCTVGVCTVLSVRFGQSLFLHNRLFSLQTFLLRVLMFVRALFASTIEASKEESATAAKTAKAPGVTDERGSQYLSEVNVDIDTCLHFTIRDFVLSWYHSLSSNNQFSKDVYYVLEDLSAALYSRIRKVNKYKFVKNFVTSYHVYFKQYLRCLEDVRRKTGKASIVECIDDGREIETCFTHWHVALSSPENEILYFKHVINIILEVLTPVDLLTCSVAKKFIVDVVANNVLLPLMDHITDPNWVNKKLITLLTDDAPSGKLALSDCDPGQNRPMFSEFTDLFASAMQKDAHSPTHNLLSGNNVSGNNLSELLQGDVSSNFTGDADVDSIDKTHFQKALDEMLLEKSFAGSDSVFSEEQNEGSKLSENLFKIEQCEKQIKSSKSFEHLSSFVLNRLGELEKPIEFITENLAHYFRIANDGAEHINPSATSPTKITLNATNAPSDSSENSKALEMFDPVLLSNLNLRRRSTSIIEQSHSISHALEDAMAASAGPVLAQKLDAVKSLPPLHTEDAVDESRVSQCTEKAPLQDSLSSTVSISSGEFDDIDGALKGEDLEVSLSLSPLSLIDPSMDLQTNFTMDQNDSVMEAVEMSPDNRCFMNLFIPSAEIAEEPGGIGHYVLYCIQYEAWYLDTSPIQTSSTESTVDVSEPRMILQGSQVKRRFREFLVLHSRLEENTQTRPFLINIQKPNRWMTLPFNKIDHDITEERRVFLERYLQRLISIDVIAASNELREFLAYGSDASIAFVKKVPDSMVPRIDKFLAKKVSGMWEKFRVVLPSSGESNTLEVPIISLAKPSERKSFLGFQFGTHEGNYPITVSFGYPEIEPDVQQLEEIMRRFVNNNKDTDWIDGLQKTRSDENLSVFCETPTPVSSDKSGISTMFFLSDEFVDPLNFEENESFFIDEDNLTKCMVCIDRDIPLASCVINLFVDGILNDKSFFKKNRFLFCFKVIAGQKMESWLHNKIDERTTMKMNIRYLRQVRDAIWPGGVLPMEPEPEKTEAEKVETKKLALNKLKEFFPSFLPLCLGCENYSDYLQVFQSSLQHPKLMRHFMYNILDLFLATVVPESKSDSFCQRFVNNIS